MRPRQTETPDRPRAPREKSETASEALYFMCSSLYLYLSRKLRIGPRESLRISRRGAARLNF